MAIPTTIESLSTTAASNGPAGSEQRTLADDGLRQAYAFIRQLVTLGANIASATTITPPSTGSVFNITGTTTITTIASTYSWDGRVITLIFADVLTLTHSSNLAMPGAVNVATSANTVAQFVQTGTGAWRCILVTRADVIEGESASVTPTMYGAVGDGSTDDTTAVQAWANSAFPKMGEPKTFKVTGQITFAVNTCKFDGRGMVIDASAGGTFTDSAVLYCLGALTATPDLSVSPSAGAVALTFGSAHGLAENDVAIIYNPTNSSFNAARTYYRAGEYIRVNRAPTTATLQLWNGLYAGYTAANVDVYKMTSNEIGIANVTVVAPAAGSIRPLRLRLGTRVRLRDVKAYGSSYTGCELDRCYDVEAVGQLAFVQPSTYNDEYGLALGNCQDVRVIGGAFYASRHAISIGGDDYTGCVPNRNVRIIGATLKNDEAAEAPAADIHGNCEDIEYHDCTIYGGASFGGIDNAYLDCTFIGGPSTLGALIAGGSECMGGTYRVQGGRIKSSAAFAYGIVRGYNGATATTKDSHLIVRDITVEMGSCDTFARFDMANDSFKANAHVSGITFVASASLAGVLRMVGTGAAGDGDYLVVDDVTNAPNGTTLYTAASGYGSTVKARMMEQMGSAAVVPVSGAAFASTSVTFRYSYGSKAPMVTLAPDGRTVNSKAIATAYRSKTATGVTVDVFTCDAANFGATTPTINVDWLAAVSEI